MGQARARQRLDENRSEAGDASPDHVGEQLVADHGGLRGRNGQITEAATVGAGPGLSGQPPTRDTELRRSTAHAITTAVRYDREAHVAVQQRPGPRDDLGRGLGGAGGQQRLVEIEQQRTHAVIGEVGETELLDPIDAEIGTEDHGAIVAGAR